MRLPEALSFELIIQWISDHPVGAGIAVFCIALSESLAVVGLLVPGVALMFVAGALIGTGALPFWPICSWAICGAIAGDGVSFWIGRRFQSNLRHWWPFRSHPEIIRHGIHFFQRFGALSILFGRFVGPVRPIVPLVAGMLAMPVSRFIWVNVVSALLWAPLYLVPGIVFGASLELAAKVTGRLAGILVVLVVMLWLGFWLSRFLYNIFQPRAHRLLLWMFDFHRRHPLFSIITGPLLFPRQRDYLALSFLALVLALAIIAVTSLLPWQPQLTLVFLHNPWGDALFGTIDRLASWPALGVFVVLVGSWLLWKNWYEALLHWLISLGFCAMTEHLATVILGPDSIDGRVLRTAVVYGFLAFLAAGQVKKPWRWVIYSVASLFLVLVICARLYFGSLSLVGLTIWLPVALLWLGIVGVGYQRHRSHREPMPGFWPMTVLALILLIGWSSVNQTEYPARQKETEISMPLGYWLSEGWRSAPRYRPELFGQSRQPLVLQWSGSLAEIQSELQAMGWQRAKRLGMDSALYWLAPQAEVTAIPVLPHFNQGNPEALVMIKAEGDQRAAILRLWDSGLRIENLVKIPVWIGAVAELQLVSLLGWVRYTDEVEPYNDLEAHRLINALIHQSQWSIVSRKEDDEIFWLLFPPGRAESGPLH